MDIQKPIYLTQHVTARGAMDRDYEGTGPLALFRESLSRRVIAVKVERKSGQNEEVQYIWQERQLLQDYIQESENPRFDLYLDEYGNKTQA